MKFIVFSIISFLDIKSLGERGSTLTLMAIFLILFIAENCFRRLRTAESRGLSGAKPPTCTHGWPKQEHNPTLEDSIICFGCETCETKQSCSSLLLSSQGLFMDSILTKNLMSCEPLLGVSYKHFTDKIFCTLGYTRPGFRNKVKFTFQNLLENPLFRF